MTSTETRPPSLRNGHIEQIQLLFRTPPSLSDVAQSVAQAYLDLHFAARNYVAGLIYLVTPSGPYQVLSQLLLARMAAARPTLLVEGFHQVVHRVRETYAPSGLNLAELEVLINHCGARVLEFYARRLQAWWNEALPVDMTRWGYLSDELLALLYDAQKPAGMSQTQFSEVFAALRLPARRPNRHWSAQGPGLKIQTLHLRQGNDAVQMLPLLLLTHSTHTWLFSPASGVHRVESVAGVSALLALHASPLLPGTGRQWFALDVQGDPFDALAASYLARQLQEIARIDPAIPRSVQDYQTLLRIITDSRRWFVPALTARQQNLREQLPLWLAHAPAEDGMAYAQLLQAAVLARQHSGTLDFLDGIASLQAYAETALQACLNSDPRAASISPGDIRLTLERVIAAAVPVPGGFIAGEVQSIDLSFTELALDTLTGVARTAKSIRLNGAPAPAWLTYDLLKGWLAQADIGRGYPALLKQQLEGNVQRRDRFSRQLRIQLPMQALEWHIKAEHGLTHTGFRRVLAALQPEAAQRRVEAQAIALWPLAFKASAEATADEVANMFVIGPERGDAGPYLLYRPLYEPPLQEYASAGELLGAIARAGDLQDSVLTWIEPRRQAVYANGGLREPHIRHFLPGDEFTRYDKPAPAQLSKTLISGDPMHRLFSATTQALVTLADRQTVSNAEQRWAHLQQLGWLLFGTLQPLLSGPWMLASWLVQLVDSTQRDFAELDGNDPQAKSAALVDLLANLMLVIAHQAAPHDAQHPLELEHPVFAPLAPIDAAPPEQVSPPAQFTALGSWSNARVTLTPELQARFQALSIKAFPHPWPSVLPGAEPSGRWQGLLRDTRHSPAQWSALVRGHQVRVRLEQGTVRVISADGTRLGPWLKRLGQGRWDIDLQLRLRGAGSDAESGASGGASGGSPSLDERYCQAGLQRARAQAAMEVARALVNKPPGQIDEQQRGQAEASYVKALNDKLQFCQEELQLLRQLRERAPRPRYEEELSRALESIILVTRLLDSQERARLQQGNERLRPLLEHMKDSADEVAHAELNRGMRDLAAIHDRAIQWRTLEQRYLDQLQQVPRLGRDRVNALNASLPVRPSIADLQSLQLTTLWGIAVDVPGPPLEDDFFTNMSATIDRARWASRSLADLPQLNTSDSERIELLDSIDHVFAQTDDRIEFWRAMEPSKFELDHLGQLQALLATMHLSVQKDLAALLQPDTETVAKPRPAASGNRGGKVIRMRNRDLFVARLSPEPAGLDTAQLHDAAGSVIGTFTEADDGVWDLEKKPAPARRDPELGSLLKKAGILLQEVDKAIAHVEAMVAKANDPLSLQELLEAQARRRTWVADAIGRKVHEQGSARLAAVQQANARTAEAQLRAAVLKLEAAGLSARVRATRNRPLSQDDVAFLHSHDEVRITRQGARVPLKGRRDDFLQVYAVNDVHTGKPLSFAHFHYARRQGPDDHFTAAHLKSPEQERLGRQAQAQVEAAAFARMRSGQGGRVTQTLEIRRAQIGLPLARRLFFSVD